MRTVKFTEDIGSTGCRGNHTMLTSVRVPFKGGEIVSFPNQFGACVYTVLP